MLFKLIHYRPFTKALPLTKKDVNNNQVSPNQLDTKNALYPLTRSICAFVCRILTADNQKRRYVPAKDDHNKPFSSYMYNYHITLSFAVNF